MPTNQKSLAEAAEQLRRSVSVVRGKSVMLDLDLAAIYQVSVTYLRQRMSRNVKRFPSDFAFQLSDSEAVCLEKKGVRAIWAFTDEGSLMLANILKSPVAAEISVRFVRALVAARPVDSFNAIMPKRRNKI